jgi:hypothetical protein
MSQAKVAETLQLMVQLSGRTVSPAAATMLARDLSRFPSESVLAALERCRFELRTFPTISEIIARLDDGRPGAEEAWAMIPQDERDSVVWTDEMAEAYGVARTLLPDAVAARMAFKETYSRLLTEARTSGRPAKWTPSLGHDKQGRAAALMLAVDKGRLALPAAQALVPELDAPRAKPALQIEDRSEPTQLPESFARFLADLRAKIDEHGPKGNP